MAGSVSIRSSQVSAAAERGMLLFPTSKTDVRPKERSIKKVKAELKDMCKDYRLQVGGNKGELQTRLREFSEKYCSDPATCNLNAVKHRSHKGPRDGPKKTENVKLSAVRRAAIIDPERVTERSKDTRTEDEIDGLLAWADRTVTRLPYEPPKEEEDQGAIYKQATPATQSSDRGLGERIQIIETQIAALTGCPESIPARWNTSSSAYSTVPMDYMIYDHAAQSSSTFQPEYNESFDFNFPTNVDWSYDPTTHQSLHISAAAAAATSTPPAAGGAWANPTPTTCGPASVGGSFMPAAWVPSSLSNFIPSIPAACGSSVPNATAPSSLSPSVASIVPSSHSASILTTSTRSPTRSFKLSNGVTINLTDEDIERLTIPAMSFASDISQLNEMWDDSSPYWKGSSVLKIHGHSIALIHLPTIFKRNNWTTHKSTWTEWKFLVERYRQGTSEEFWTEFTAANGSKMSYTAILDHLRDARKGSDEEVADRARVEYGAEFESKFSYRCSRTKKKVVMTKASAIAKMYRRLHPLST